MKQGTGKVFVLPNKKYNHRLLILRRWAELGKIIHHDTHRKICIYSIQQVEEIFG
jgi:hypothetical protein